MSDVVGVTRPEIIAEIGLNHGGDVELGRRLIDSAARAGADTVKFQTYQTYERVGRGHQLWDVLESCSLTPDETQRLKEHAISAGVQFLSTAFGTKSLQTLGDLGVERVKIASFSIANEDLVGAALAGFAAVLVSTGTATAAEISQVCAIASRSSASLTLMHCVSSYPTAVENANLSNIPALRLLSGRPIGYSDHTLGTAAAAMATALGAVSIEKHFTIDRTLAGPDHAMSADPSELARLVQECAAVAAMWGVPRSEEPYACEAPILPFRVVTSSSRNSE